MKRDFWFRSQGVSNQQSINKPKLEQVSNDGKLAVISLPSLASHPSIRGPYHRGLPMKVINPLDEFSSGVQLVAISFAGEVWAEKVRKSFLKRNLRQVFKVVGEFGVTSSDWTVFGLQKHFCDYHLVEKKWLEKKLKYFTDDHQNMILRQLKVRSCCL